jgi:two-component system, OmpR family, sensor histidine kinase TctE
MADRSLRLQLLTWLLIPLAGIVIVNTWITYRNARVTAGIITDRTLLASARSMAEQIQSSNGVMEAIIPPSALEMFASEAGDRVYYRIDDTTANKSSPLIAGSPDLPSPPHPPDDLSPRYFDAEFRGQVLHLVAIRQPVTGNPPRAAQIVVGETTGARAQMVADLWIQGFLQQGLLVLIVGILASFGLQRGLRPLLRLRDEVVERRPDDLRPLTATALQHELQPLATALNQYMGRVKNWSAVQRRFIANAAHQLRTPLTLLSTQATYALRATSAGEKDEALRAIQANMQQMTRLANQLLTLAQAEPGGRPPPKEPVDLVATARRALESLVGVALERDMDLGFDPQVTHAMALGEPTMLQELVVNLVDNALRYTPAGGVVTLGIDRDGAGWRLTVQDSGPGIAEAERERVFERFYRTLGSGAEGSGLGLAIAKEIVEGAGGSISLTDSPAPGGGLLVTVYLPAVDPAAAP